MERSTLEEQERKEREMDLEVIKEEGRVIIAREKSTGKELRMIKIDMKEMERAHKERIEKVAQNLSIKTASILVNKLAEVLSTDVSVSSHKLIALELTDIMERCYNEVGNPNLFHFPIKNISPEIYGKSHTFLKEVEMLFGTMVEVFHCMRRIEKIKDFEVIRQPMLKFTTVTQNPEFAKGVDKLTKKYGGTTDKERFKGISIKIS